MTDAAHLPTREQSADADALAGGLRSCVALAAALAVPLAAVSPAVAAAPSDTGGKRVPRTQIGGDGFSTPDAIGARGLVGGGVRFHVNTDMTAAEASSASSASGAIDDAEMTAARNDVSTLNGGTTSATLQDAFDGYDALAVHVGPGAPSGAPSTADAGFTFYNRNGPATSSCGGRQLDFAPQVFAGGLTISRSVYVPADQPVERALNVLTNTGVTPIDVTVYTSNNLGSDAGTTIYGSSSGDQAAGLDDTWVGTFQNFSGTTSPDLRLAHVLRGTTGPALRSVTFANGVDNPTWSYQLTLQPGQTRIVAGYVVAEASEALAARRAAALADSPLTACMTRDQTLQLANFDLADRTPPAIANVPAGPVVKAAPGARSAVVRYTPPTASDAVDGAVAVTCTPPSGSSFPIGTTLVTCTAVDSSGNRARATFQVVVRAPPALSRFGLSVTCTAPADGTLRRLVVRFKVAASAGVTVRVERRAVRRAPTRCPPARIGGRARWRKVASAKRQLRAGRHAFTLTLRRSRAPAGTLPLLGSRGLAPGYYRIVLSARNADGTVRRLRVLAVAAPH